MLLTKTKLDEVFEKVEDDQEGKADYITNLNNLRADREGNIAFLRTNEVDGPMTRDIPFDLTDWAEGQLYGKLGLPAQYFKKVRAEAPKLFAEHFNYWAGKAEGATRLRARINEGSYNGVIRGAVSDKYSVLDNDEVMDALEKILRGRESDYKIETFYMDNKRMHLRMTYLDMTKPVGRLPDGSPDYMRIGTDIINSEVGASSFNLVKMIWRLICDNGLRGWDKEDSFVQRHIHLRPVEFRGRVADAMVNQLHAGRDFLEELQKTQEQQIENPFAVIGKLAEEGGFSRFFVDTAKKEFEGDNTAYGVINSFTRAARELPNERRLEAEKFAGKLTRFTPSKWEKLDAIEMEQEAM